MFGPCCLKSYYTEQTRSHYSNWWVLFWIKAQISLWKGAHTSSVGVQNCGPFRYPHKKLHQSCYRPNGQYVAVYHTACCCPRFYYPLIKIIEFLFYQKLHFLYILLFTIIILCIFSKYHRIRWFISCQIISILTCLENIRIFVLIAIA